MIYFDNAAATPMAPEVLAVLSVSFKEDFANPSAAHELGKNLFKRIEKARQDFLIWMDAVEEYHFTFTSSATESNNTIIKGLGLKADDAIFYFKGDHPSIVAPIHHLHGNFTQAFHEKCKLAVFTHINGQSGQLKDVVKLSKEIKEKNPNCWVHIDGVQGFAKYPLCLNQSTIDSYSLSSHKIRGPKGVAGLYIKKGKKISPLLEGGGQEHGRRASTQPAPLIFSFALAAELAFKRLQENHLRVLALNEYFKAKLLAVVPNVILPFADAGPYILTFIIPKLPSDVMLRHLQQNDVFMSSSSACSSKIKGFNETFSALGIAQKYHKNVFRISFGEQNNQGEVDQFFNYFKVHYKNLERLLR